jgi:2-oxoglutarate ferredoxin oxidoreductase subunit delta
MNLGNGIMRIEINREYCKGCDLCIIVCPRKVFEEGKEMGEWGVLIPIVAHPERCPNIDRRDKCKAVCELCILTCPDQAIQWREEE